MQDLQIVLTPEGLGFYKDPLDAQTIYTWALLGAICHPILPFSPHRLTACLNQTLEVFARAGITEPTIVTETFELKASPEPERTGSFLWINSPRARIYGTFDTYVSSLSSSRRQQMRHLFDCYAESKGFRFEFSDRIPDTKETDFILENLGRRWGMTDTPYAVVQNLWPIAVSAVMPDRSRFMRVYYKGVLAFLNAFILRDDVIIAQSTCKNTELSFDGLGVAIDFKAIQLLSGRDSRICHLDPTCRMTVLDDAPNIGIAKRKVVNENAHKRTFLAGYGLPALDVPYPHLDPVKHWVIPEAPVVIGRPA
jgi:hypothetical protein